MKIFISWSGPTSKAVAEILRSWLPNVIQSLEPWVSATDIDKGARWSSDIASQLATSRVGIICLTAENLDEPWIMFEAGALSKTLEKTYVCPYLLDIEPSVIKGPLAQFQMTRAQEVDTQKLMHTINRALDTNALAEATVDKSFEKWWPELEDALKRIPRDPNTPKPIRSGQDLLEEMLELVRGQTQILMNAQIKQINTDVFQVAVETFKAQKLNDREIAERLATIFNIKPIEALGRIRPLTPLEFEEFLLPIWEKLTNSQKSELLEDFENVESDERLKKAWAKLDSSERRALVQEAEKKLQEVPERIQEIKEAKPRNRRRPRPFVKSCVILLEPSWVALSWTWPLS